MMRKVLVVLYFGFLAGVGILLGCFIHGARVNQPTIMSGVAFVRELPYGEQTVGAIETLVFSYQEEQSLKRYREEHKDKIKIDPKVLEEHKRLYRGGADPARQ